jgi:hypothetical protein
VAVVPSMVQITRPGSAGVRGVHHCCEPHIRLECAIDLLLRAVLRGRSDAQGQSQPLEGKGSKVRASG